MPAIGAGSFRQLPPAPKAPPPPASTTTGNNPRGVAIAPPKPQPVPKALSTGANPRGTAIVQPSHGVTVNDVQAVHPDPVATIKVFKAQPKNTQQQILSRAQQTPDLPASKIVLNYARESGGYHLPLAAINPSPTLATLEKSSGPITDFVAKLFVNAGKDAATLPAETLSTGATIGGDVAGGHIGKAISDFVSPYEQLIKDPIGTFEQHPLLTPLMAAPFVDVPTRIGAGAIKAAAPESVLGKAADTSREGVALTGKLTHERPAYSPYPRVKAMQAAQDAALYKRNEMGELVPKSNQLRTRLTNQEVGQVIGTRERVRVANRELTRQERESSVRPSLTKRAAHTAKTTFKYNPKAAAVPGAEVLSRIADTTVRRPDTITEDLLKHAEQVSANRPDLLDDAEKLKAHDEYVKQIADAAKNKKFLKNPGPAFAAAEKYGEDYAPVQARAAALGHFGDMSQDAFDRRALMHYAQTHMGATMDDDPVKVAAYEKALEDLPKQHPDWTFGQLQAALAKVRPDSQLLDATGKPLANATILKHLNSKEGTGGRMPSYTSDRSILEDTKKSYYPGERRPLPVTQKNRLYNYSHGLTEPSHEGLTRQHIEMQGIVDAHRSQNAYAETLSHSKPDGTYWSSRANAKASAPPGYSPINLSQPFHPQSSLDQALEDVHPATIEEEALRHSFDLSDRMKDGPGNRWGLIENQAAKAVKNYQAKINPDTTLRTIRGLNNQFRTVALATSFKHIPGVAQENLIRDIANGVGFRSWLTGRRMLSGAEKINPTEGRDIRTSLTGGQVVGMTQAGKTYLVSDHWAGTNAYPFLKAYEAMAKAPGPRQMVGLWKSWVKFSLGTTKHLLEQQHQIAGLGKAALREHGYGEAARTAGFMGIAQRAMGLHGQLLEDATKGMYDPAKLRQLRASINRLYGKWTDLSPGAQSALMFSPFGLWWANSAKFIMRMPVDQPVITGGLAAATVGTQKEREAKGLDLFSPGHLPLYEQGGIPDGGKILAQNYYSPFGIANNPLETGISLAQPWAIPAAMAAYGVDWLGKPLTAPGQNTNKGNEKTPSTTQRIQAILDSAAASFVPLYTKAGQVAEGGASAYDVSPGGAIPPLLRGKAPATKTPGAGPLVGLEKATAPFRKYATETGFSSSSAPVMPGAGSVSGAVMPGSGSVSNAVMP